MFRTSKLTTSNQGSHHVFKSIRKIHGSLTEHGVMAPERLYESPFTDINPQGPEGVFPSATVDKLVVVLTEIRQRADFSAAKYS